MDSLLRETKTSSAECSFDREAVLVHVDHDRTLLREMAQLLFEDAPEVLEQISEALEDQDIERLWQAAHALKGTVSNFAAERARTLAQELETVGRKGELARASDLLVQLRAEVEHLFDDLRTFLELDRR